MTADDGAGALERTESTAVVDEVATATVNLGLLLALQGDLEGARAAFERAIQTGHAEHAPQAAVGLGVLLQRQGDLAGARAAFHRAIESGHAEHAPKASASLGLLLQRQGDVHGARAALNRAIESGHADHAPRAALGLGVLLQQQGDLDGAREAYEHAVDSSRTQAGRLASAALAALELTSSRVDASKPRATPARLASGTAMAYSTAEARQDLLDAVADAIDDLARALAALGAAYELLDEHKADELEEAMFGPVQVAYGRAQRTHSEFAARSALPGRTFTTPDPGAPSTGLKGYVDDAVAAVTSSDATLATLQDSMMPIEVGDAELRAGLAQVRELVADVPQRARALVRTIGR